MAQLRLWLKRKAAATVTVTVTVAHRYQLALGLSPRWVNSSIRTRISTKTRNETGNGNKEPLGNSLECYLELGRSISGLYFTLVYLKRKTLVRSSRQ